MTITGTLVNALAIIGGGAVGIVFHRHFPERLRLIVFQALGLAVLILGIDMALKSVNVLIVVFSLLIGGIAGELMNLEHLFENLGNGLKGLVRSKDARFTDGLITASLVFCIGAMAVVGSIDEGVRGDPTVLLTKSILDGFAAIVFGSTYGAGVLFSAIPVFLYQGSLTMFAGFFQQYFTEPIIAQLTSVGGALIIGIAINLLEIKRINISNLLPSLAVVVALTYFFA